MKVIIFHKKTFEFIEALEVSNDYQIILDIVLNQSSYFVTNHHTTNASVGDIIILHERSFFYIGIVTGIELTEIGQVKLTTVDYLTSLDFEISVIEFNGNLGDELIRYIRVEYINNPDIHQNRPFLTFENELNVIGKINASEDKLTKFSDFSRDVYKHWGVRLHARLGIVKGKITHIKIVATSSANEFILSSNFPMIRGLTISDNKDIKTNKITFIPSKENIIHTYTENYYLLVDGSITTNMNDELRIRDVVEKKQIYKDSDLKGSVYSHKFRSGQIKTAAGSVTLSGVSWQQSAATYIGFDGGANDRGVQIGSSSNPNIETFTLTTPIFNFGSNIKVTEVKITLATVSILNEYAIQVGNVTTGFKSISSIANKVYTTGRRNGVSGNIVISLRATTGAMYISKIEVSYQPVDSDTETLLDKASRELLSEDYMHNINFSIAQDNLVFIPLNNIYLGDKVRFIHGDKSWATILSRIEMTSTTKDFLITLGEERIKLTEKLKIILEGRNNGT